MSESNVVTMPKADANEKTLSDIEDMIVVESKGLAEKALDHFLKTYGKSSFTIKCELSIKKGEVKVKVSGNCTLAIDGQERDGDVLNGQLRLY